MLIAGKLRRQGLLALGVLMVCQAAAMGICLAQEPAKSTPSQPETTNQSAENPAPAPVLINVVLHLESGDILIGLDQAHAPITVNNFLRYVDLKRFDGSTFYRAVKIDEEGKYGLVQGGLKGNPKRIFKPIPNEAPSVTGLSHVDGAISMARREPGTATADFFIVIGDLVSLDGEPTGGDPGYAVFGKVIDGMEIVRKILDQPRDAAAGEGVMKGQMLAKPITILTIRRAN
jgi:peptidyl-prolyl cis-trans isomerase A (cyclophilin A)